LKRETFVLGSRQIRRDVGERFLDGAEAELDLEHAVLVERLHAALDREALDLGGLGLGVDRSGELLTVGHEFVDADAALVAGAAAGRAALRVGLEDFAAPAEGLFEDFLFAAGGRVGLLAIFADTAHEALGADADE